MTATAKLFKTGSSQAVRLPKAYRLPGNEAWIRKIESSGEIVLSGYSYHREQCITPSVG